MPTQVTESINYLQIGGYNRAAFQAEFDAQFAQSPRYNADAIPDLLELLALIGSDPAITDIRWAAYMLATVLWETTYPVRISRPARDRAGRPLLDRNGAPVMLNTREWRMTMAPVDEVGFGRGRRYHEPVKVKRLPDGSARITEADGDQFRVSVRALVTPLTRGAAMGSPSGAPAEQIYTDDDGTPNAYYGRGYVQLTWWSNYAAAGVALRRGLDLLFDPELVKQRPIAYAIMAHGMRTGFGFANGRRFVDYFGGTNRNYVGARAMVNGSDHAADIAAIAEKFEVALLKARV